MERQAVKKIIFTSIVVAMLAVAYTVLAPANAMPSDKYDGGCTGMETAGRCADKCPNQTDTLLGYDEKTGAAICKAAPTGDSIPLGPDCDKHAPQINPALVDEPEQFEGK